MTTQDDARGQLRPTKRASGLNKVIAHNIARLRVDRVLTQAELARRAGIPRASILGIESGARLVAINDLPSVCFALNCSMADLLEGDDDLVVSGDGMPLFWARRTLLPQQQVESPIEGALRALIREEVRRAL